MNPFDPIRDTVERARQALAPLGLDLMTAQIGDGFLILQVLVGDTPVQGPSLQELADKARVDAEFESIAEGFELDKEQERQRLLQEDIRRREAELE